MTASAALGEFYRRMRVTLGAPRAITAAAHKLAGIIFHLVTTRQEFDDSRFTADQLRYEKRQEAKLRAKAHTLGFQLIPVQHPEVVPLEFPTVVLVLSDRREDNQHC